MLGPNRPWICGVYVQPSHFSAQGRTREAILATDKTFHCWVNEVIKAALSQQDSTETQCHLLHHYRTNVPVRMVGSSIAGSRKS
jgi:hypothetical protein